MIKKIATGVTAFVLLSIVTLGVVSASPNTQTSVRSASFQFLTAVLMDADDKGALSEGINELLADLLIEYLIAPQTGETVQQVRDRLSVAGQSTFQFLTAVLMDADGEGVLSDDINELLADLLIEYLIAPQTGETVQQARDRLSLQSAQPDTSTTTATTTPIATPDASLALGVTAELAGYYSGGEAGVDVILSLADTEHPWREGVQIISIVCRWGAEVIVGCGDELEITLPGGGEAVIENVALRMPMGSVSLEFDFGGVETLTLPVYVPERILGVERDVWECFRDEPDTLNPSEDNSGYFGDCAGWGWGNLAMWKWDQDIPVNVWATGREDYIATLDETLYELSPLLDLDFLWVNSEEEATLKAYMGIPKSQVVSAGFPEFCAGERIAGCGGPNTPIHGGLVESGAFGVWRYLDESRWWTDVGLLDTLIKHVTVHEALHALVPMAHRADPASIMNTHNTLNLPTLSRMDEDLIRLHQHHLVKPGMIMSEIEQLIVFREELLDSPPPRELDGYELVRSAFGTLQDADSARFRISGGWKSSRCNSLFGWADYEIADFGPSYANITHFEDGGQSHFLIAPKDEDSDWEYWSYELGQWREIGQEGVYGNTKWRSSLSSPHTILASILFFSDADDIGVSKNRDGGITLRATLDDAYARVSWSKGETLEVVLTLDEDTLQILEYEVEWLFDVREPTSCPRYTTKAVNGEYGIELRIPDAIRERSFNISASPNRFPFDPGNIGNIPFIGSPAKTSD